MCQEAKAEKNRFEVSASERDEQWHCTRRFVVIPTGSYEHNDSVTISIVL